MKVKLSVGTRSVTAVGPTVFDIGLFRPIELVLILLDGSCRAIRQLRLGCERIIAHAAVWVRERISTVACDNPGG